MHSLAGSGKGQKCVLCHQGPAAEDTRTYPGQLSLSTLYPSPAGLKWLLWAGCQLSRPQTQARSQLKAGSPQNRGQDPEGHPARWRRPWNTLTLKPTPQTGNMFTHIIQPDCVYTQLTTAHGLTGPRNGMRGLAVSELFHEDSFATCPWLLSLPAQAGLCSRSLVVCGELGLENREFQEKNSHRRCLVAHRASPLPPAPAHRKNPNGFHGQPGPLSWKRAQDEPLEVALSGHCHEWM